MDRPCPGGAFDRRELWRFMGGINGSAPGTVSSVSPALEFGALARKDGVSGIVVEGERAERREVGDAVQVHPGLCVRAMESTFRFSMAGSAVGGCCFCSMTVPRHDSISSSFIGEAPRWPKGLRPRPKRYARNSAAAINKMPTNPNTVERTIIKVRRDSEVSFGTGEAVAEMDESIPL